VRVVKKDNMASTVKKKQKEVSDKPKQPESQSAV
jgi:hypothetical protein